MWVVQISDLRGVYVRHERNSYVAARNLFDALVHQLHNCWIALLDLDGEYVDFLQIRG